MPEEKQAIIDTNQNIINILSHFSDLRIKNELTKVEMKHTYSRKRLVRDRLKESDEP